MPDVLGLPPPPKDPPSLGVLDAPPPPPAVSSDGPDPSTLRSFSDIPGLRTAIWDKTLEAARAAPPYENARHRFELIDADWAGPAKLTRAEEKTAVLEGKSLTRRLRGRFRMTDKATGQVVDEHRLPVTMANIPYLTDQGVFTLDGIKYGVAGQARSKSGAYGRWQDSGGAEVHFNAEPGTGRSHYISVDPATDAFIIRQGKDAKAKAPLLPLLEALGVSSKDAEAAWGPEVFRANRDQAGQADLKRLYDQFVRVRPGEEPATTDDTRQTALVAAFHGTKLDPTVTKRTLGHPHDRADGPALLAGSDKVLKMRRGEAGPDDRVAPANLKFMGPENLIAERVQRAMAGAPIRKLFWAATGAGGFHKPTRSAGPVFPAGFLDPHVRALIRSSGLAQSPEEVNPGELLGHMHRVTRMGEGGIEDSSAIPLDARSVVPGQYGFVDSLISPESSAAGVDERMAAGVRRGKDGNIYAPFRDARTGKEVYRAPHEVADSVIAFPGEMAGGEDHVRAIVAGKIRYAHRKDVDYEVPHHEPTLTPLANLVPLKSAMKQHRTSMAVRMLSQALPLSHPESRLVRSGMPDKPGRSYDEEYGPQFGAVRSEKGGTVVKVGPGGVQVRGEDGQVTTHELYDGLPSNRKTQVTQTPTVRVGDRIPPDGLLARSNYTDERGHVALGANLRTAYMPAGKGQNYEDAIVISRSAAENKLASEHLYQHHLELEPGIKTDVTAYRSGPMGRLHPDWGANVYDAMDDEGVVRPGTRVQEGHPLVLASKLVDRGNRLTRGGQRSEDASVMWDHKDPGVVTDVARTKKGVLVAVRTSSPMQTGDKACYDPATELLTESGWKPVDRVTLGDRVASLAADGTIEYLHPEATHSYHHSGRMYRLETTQVSLCVTDNHKLYVDMRSGSEYVDDYSLQEASRVSGRRYRLKRNGEWVGKTPEYVELPALAVKAGQGGRGIRIIPPLQVPSHTYAMLLGMFLSEGNLAHIKKSGTYGFEITQIKPAGRARMFAALRAAGIRFTDLKYKKDGRICGKGVRIHSIQWMLHLQQFGHAADKFIPNWMFDWESDTLRILYDWLMWGDGSTGGTGHSYWTSSPKLADDVQRLALHIGMSANVERRKTPPTMIIMGRECKIQPQYHVSIYRSKNRPEINHGHSKTQKGQTESWIDYEGPVHCVTLPRNHVMYVRRNGKPVWCGNSAAHGNKGVVSVREDSEMPKDKHGRPFEILFNDLGIITRGNVSQAHETWLGKVAAKTGRPEVIPDFADIKDLREHVAKRLKDVGEDSYEEVETPEGDRPKVMTGVQYVMKLSHRSEDKASGRSTGGYDVDEVPARGGGTGSKKQSLQESGALLSYGAHGILADRAVRGQKNRDLWDTYLRTGSMPETQVPVVYHKFLAHLRGAGVDPFVEQSGRTRLKALTDKALTELAGNRETLSDATVDERRGLAPVPGGLFDPLIHGVDGKKWSGLRLSEPMPIPAFEDPIRRLLNLSAEKFRSVLRGDEPLGNRRGPAAIRAALADIDVPRALNKARDEFRTGRKATRDDAARKIGLLKGAMAAGIHPKDWVVDRSPVLPPAYRPIVALNDGTVQYGGINDLYRSAIQANKALGGMLKVVEHPGDERENLYTALKATAGLGDPLATRGRQEPVKGLLKKVFGDRSKFSTVQGKLLSGPVDAVGRAVLAPGPDMGMDEAGLPEQKAWDVYKPHIARELIKTGIPVLAAERMVEHRDPKARQALERAMADRPVLVSRSPVLHRYNILALHPRIVPGDSISLSPLVYKGLGADADGDTLNFHVPATARAVKNALEKMLPSSNLLSVATGKVHQKPTNEFQGGLYRATAPDGSDAPVRHFTTKALAIAAYRRGEIRPDQEVVIGDDKT